MLRVATWTKERGGFRSDPLGMFIIIGKMGEGESEEARKRGSGRMEENSEAILFKKLKEG